VIANVIHHRLGVALAGGAPLPAPDSVTAVYFEGGWRDTPVYLLPQLLAGMAMPGPAVIMNGRGVHSSTCRLNLSTFCWIRQVHVFPPVY
jgi:hypothetical protein